VSGERVESWGGEDHVVRRVTGSAATKSYRCPGCHQLIRPATPHTVAWPVLPSTFSSTATGLEERRHWHNGCWASRNQRR
jgi:hypothetical protein